MIIYKFQIKNEVWSHAIHLHTFRLDPTKCSYDRLDIQQPLETDSMNF